VLKEASIDAVSDNIDLDSTDAVSGKVDVFLFLSPSLPPSLSMVLKDEVKLWKDEVKYAGALDADAASAKTRRCKKRTHPTSTAAQTESTSDRNMTQVPVTAAT